MCGKYWYMMVVAVIVILVVVAVVVVVVVIIYDYLPEGAGIEVLQMCDRNLWGSLRTSMLAVVTVAVAVVVVVVVVNMI